MKVTVITPTYNDEKTIVTTLDSIRNQTYKDWESIIIDDGSTDNTKNVILEYINKYKLENKIKYIYQENADQLNAIINGIQYITGDYVSVLHSDDLLPSDDFFEKSVEVMKANPNYDAIIGDLVIINENGDITNTWKALEYRKKDYIPAILILNNGANIYGDCAFHKVESYKNNVLRNYLTWNTPFWLDLDDNANMLNVKKVDFPILKYRIHSENYISNNLGKFNALNGELRTLTRLMSIYNIPAFKFQRGILKFLRMPGIRKFKLTPYFKLFYRKEETRNKYELVKMTIENTYQNLDDINIYLKSLLLFYKNIDKERTINLENINENDIYFGKDIRIFSKKLFDGTLPSIYANIFKEMEKGFTEIIVNNENDMENAEKLMKFLCLYPYVKIRIKE